MFSLYCTNELVLDDLLLSRQPQMLRCIFILFVLYAFECRKRTLTAAEQI